MQENETELQDIDLKEAPIVNRVDFVEEYDPHDNRNVPNATSNRDTLIHLLKGSLGTGIMAMPQAFYLAGYGTGIIGTIIIAVISTYCLLMLVRNQYKLCKRYRIPMLTYPQAMKIALLEGPSYLRWFARIAVPFIDGFLVIYHGGICCVYVVFVAENIKQLVDSTEVLDKRIHMTILILPLILLMSIRNLKRLAPFSCIANVITMVGLIFIFYYFFKNGVTSPSDRIAFNSINNFPLFFGTVLFAINAVGVVVAVENNMRTPKSFDKVLVIAMAIISILYTFFGFFGYLRYGSECSGSITLNFPKEEGLAISIKIIFTIATFISYALHGYVPISIIWGTYVKKRFAESKKIIYYEIGVRACFVVVTFAIACSIPIIGLFISLVGAFCISVLAIICPALMELCILPKDEITTWILSKNLFLILVGIVGLIAGTYTSVRDIYNVLTSDDIS